MKPRRKANEYHILPQTHDAIRMRKILIVDEINNS
jgi:hypoxanthine phosphoribosyltransferase